MIHEEAGIFVWTTDDYGPNGRVNVGRRKRPKAGHISKPTYIRQCMLLGIGRSSLYYAATGESSRNLELMRRIDVQFLETPFFGARQMARWLRRQGYDVNRKRVARDLGTTSFRAETPVVHTREGPKC